MILLLATQVLQIVSTFLAFLSGAIAIRLVFITRGGLASQAIKYISIGTFCLLFAFLAFSFGISADKLRPFTPNFFNLFAVVFSSLGFGSIAKGSYILFKELR